MIEAIARIGQDIMKEQNSNSLDKMIQNPNTRSNYPYTVIIDITLDEGGYKWGGVDLEETSSDFKRYLYRKGSSRGANYSLTALITEMPTTFEIKVMGWLKQVTTGKNSDQTKAYFNQIKDMLYQNQDQIIASVNKKCEGIREGRIITLRINRKYLYEIPQFAQAFLFLVEQKDQAIAGNGKACSLCGAPKEVGNMTIYKFYTTDKPGFISGGFDEEKSWRNYPVCLECKDKVEAGKCWIEKELSFFFYGMSYYLIPKFLLQETVDTEILDIFRMAKSKVLLNTENRRKITSDENEILELLADQHDWLTMNFLFLKKTNSAERILLLIEDVLPSRLRNIFRAKKEVDKLFYNDRDSSNTFNYGRIRRFFNKSNPDKREADLDKYFLEIVHRTFKGGKLNPSFLASFFMKEIRREFLLESENFHWLTWDALADVVFFEQLDLLPKYRGDSMNRFTELFKKYGGQLNTSEKQGIFLLGALTQFLLQVQYSERNSKPFMKQLMGLKLDEQAVKGLLPKVINKLDEYDAYYKSYQTLAEEIADLFLASPAKWKLSLNELNFIFVSGMALANKIKED